MPNPRPTPAQLLLLVAPVLLALLLYRSVGTFGYVWDDIIYLENSARYQDFSLWMESLGQPFLNTPNYFRPLVLGMFLLEQQAGGGAPALSHWVNLGVFLCNLALTMVLALRVARQVLPLQRVAAAGVLAGLIYALHPVLVEPVSWISARFDLLVAFFSLCLLAVEGLRRPLLRLGGIFVLYLLAALSKEMALGTAVLLPIWMLLFKPREETPLAWLLRREQVLALLMVALAGLAYLAIRAQLLGHLYVADDSQLVRGTPERLALVVKTVGSYLLLLLAPYSSISPVHLDKALPWHAPAMLAGAVMCAALPLLAWRLLRGRAPQWLQAPGLLLLGLYAALLPVLNLLALPIGDNYVHERFLVLPCSLFAILAGVGGLLLWDALPRAGLARPLAGLVLGALLLLDVLSLRVSLPFWQSEVGLWTLVQKREPDYGLGQVNLVAAYLDQGRVDEAEALLRQAQERQGAALDYRLKINYAALLIRRGEYAPARELLLQAQERMPPNDATNRAPLYQFLAMTAFMLEGPAPARAHLARGLERDARAAPLLALLAATYYWEGDRVQGDAAVARALENPRADRAMLEAKVASILELKRRVGGG